jgi:hypothetical protein
VNLATQKTRYPRSPKSSQSANSRQKAKRPSSGKRKTSSSWSYSKSEQPFSVKYISTSYRISSQRCPWPLVWERFVRLRASMIITVTVAWRRQSSICRVAIFSVAGWPYREWQRVNKHSGLNEKGGGGVTLLLSLVSATCAVLVAVVFALAWRDEDVLLTVISGVVLFSLLIVATVALRVSL